MSFVIDLKLRPIIKALVSNRAQAVCIHAINDAVLQEFDESDIKYSDLVITQKDTEGKIIALTTNSKSINRLKSKISDAVQDKLSKSEISEIYIPVGTLFGAEILSGWGPSIPLKISISGSIFTEFVSSFCAAGINQTKHQICLNIHTKVGALVPGYPASTDVNTNIEIAETIIVGQVPNVYASNAIDEVCKVNQLESCTK